MGTEYMEDWSMVAMAFVAADYRN
ncbi:uncharacterized protein G2W53_028089 [Senna tora]|uniref:Uncharacterized protein n=1 Tax=Senna tora TaxID=362788 RepID=A0A834T1Z7_9FABA|nr:uncharacterized protein G2W53_028089 [Senna tora]